MTRDPHCPCALCAPPAPHWSESWLVILPAFAVAIGVIFLTWTGRLVG